MGSSDKIEFISWNVNSDRRISEAWKDKDPRTVYKWFHYYDYPNRRHLIECELNDMTSNPNRMISIQEVDSDAERHLKEFASRNGLEIVFTPYCLDENSFKLVNIWNSKSFKLVKHEQWPYTTDGMYLSNKIRFAPQNASDEEKNAYKEKVCEHGYGEMFEKAAACLLFKHIDSEKEFYVVNTHLPLRNFVKNRCARHLVRKIGELEKKVPVICMGDWNQMDFGSSMLGHNQEQMGVLMESGFVCMGNIYMRDRGTFCPFPYDVTYMRKDLADEFKSAYEDNNMKAYPELLQNVIKGLDLLEWYDRLDDFYVKGINPSGCEMKLYGKYEEIDGKTARERMIKSITEGVCSYPSDHFPIMLSVNISKMG